MQNNRFSTLPLPQQIQSPRQNYPLRGHVSSYVPLRTVATTVCQAFAIGCYDAIFNLRSPDVYIASCVCLWIG